MISLDIDEQKALDNCGLCFFDIPSCFLAVYKSFQSQKVSLS